MKTPLIARIQTLIADIIDERGQHHFNKAKSYPSIDPAWFEYFTLHMTTTEGRTLKQHGQYHAGEKIPHPNGGWLGLDWPGTAYTIGASNDHGIVLAWPFTNITYHAGWHANRKAVGGVIEGNFDKRAPTRHEYEMGLAMKVFCDEALKKRLKLKYHDEWKKGWRCPGKYFDKEYFANLENQYYTELHQPPPIEPKEPTPPQPEPEEPPQEEEDPASDPRAEKPSNSRGCLAFFCL